MGESKPFWASWTLWGAVAAFIGVVAPGFGINVDPTNVTHFFESFQQMLDSILTFGGLATVVYGRMSATKELRMS